MSVSPDELRVCARVLEALAADRALLAGADPALRRTLLEAAGKLAHPTRTDVVRLKKALRRKDRVEQKAHDAAVLARTSQRRAAAAPVYLSPPPSGEVPAAQSAGELLRPRACYVCKALYTRVHHHYHALCPDCAAHNWEKRRQSAPLHGRVALVTGARVKIGYQTALKLLRAGATVVATTRFPQDAARRYAREPDFAEWKDRLVVHGLDLRHAPSVELFAAHLGETLPRLDVLVNNAAQTVRRPAAFYRHLLAGEESPLPEELRGVLAARDAWVARLSAGGEGAMPARGGAGAELVRWSGQGAAAGILAPHRLSQVPLAPDDLAGAEHFPLARFDGDLQQVDTRPVNSWRLAAAEVPLAELVEVHLVNAIAPFLLVSRLRPLLARAGTGESHVINVSAMEAQFARKKKTDKHPHTNMAKAALNMLTRTSAADYARDRIWMNSVDTGWVTDEDPLHYVERKQQVHEFFPPLDVVDGAARVLDPLFTGLLTGRHPFGLFFKDYRPVEW